MKIALSTSASESIVSIFRTNLNVKRFMDNNAEPNTMCPIEKSRNHTKALCFFHKIVQGSLG